MISFPMQGSVNQDLFFQGIGEPGFSQGSVNQDRFFTGVGKTKDFPQGGSEPWKIWLAPGGHLKPGPVSSNGRTPGSLFQDLFPKSWRSFCFPKGRRTRLSVLYRMKNWVLFLPGVENQDFSSLEEGEPLGLFPGI